ncbi:MAG TPA: hypothetical protein VNV66_17725 [Pilimelia sp.]|nr:hypothetical protein [Pilimelia sp.]
MNRLERRYRLVLRLLPADYRRAWEDDMVAAFLDSMDTEDPEAAAYLADYGRPPLREVASVVGLAARLRLGGAGASPRWYAWGRAVRLAVLMAMLTHAAMATGGLAVTLWGAGGLPWLPEPGQWALTWPEAAWRLAANAWLPAYLALVLGYRPVAQALALLAIGSRVVGIAVEDAAGTSLLAASLWANLLLDAVLVAAMVAFHRDAEPVPRRPWLWVLPIGVLAVPVPLFTLQATRPGWLLPDWPGLCCVLVTAAVAVHLVVRRRRRPARTLPWSLAFTLLAAATLGLRLVTLADLRPGAEESVVSALFALGAVEAAVVWAVGVPLAVLTARALRRLPAVRTGPPGPAAPAG